ncbi:MaoC family dehydratase [Micromonospora halotolerans]|uniref:MaoC family dehydratase n=1 Tax=Micromonospora halotolerans TaxID=709879 RepID=A0ABY9ZW82_9ACTN|nr:MaoC family dehydratase [Micromonospora halotolerans]WNM39280.1 MaoC family dehydratase [Micromonospora halotolerans]
MSTYESIAAFLKHEGEMLGTTQWQAIDQGRINAFADVTGDHQWIHVDERRALAESPFGKTVAHGAFTLSLCSAFLSELIHVNGVRLVVNGGLNKVRFRMPVLVGSRVRGVATLTQARPLSNGARVVVQVKVEIEGETKPACIADQVLVFYG